MRPYYSTTATTNVAPLTFNPFLPTVGRVLEVLMHAGPPGSTIQVCNRDLARRVQCSASAIPGALRTLEAKGLVERVTTARGSLIVVLDRSGMPDRSDSAAGCDQPC